MAIDACFPRGSRSRHLQDEVPNELIQLPIRNLASWDDAPCHRNSVKVCAVLDKLLYITLRNHFYYGSFEYPKGGGKWYIGKHTPIITKDLFDKVQEKMLSYSLNNEPKEFAFTRLMTCTLCGSGITACEKFKKQQNGNVHRYVYYGCCRFQDKNCPSGYLREDALIEQLANLMDKIDLDEIGMKERIKAEIERHKKFQSGILGIKGQSVKVGDVDVRNYAKYVLRDGTIFEKRELLTCLRSKITMAKKKIEIA